jgi:hypothetical protein
MDRKSFIAAVKAVPLGDGHPEILDPWGKGEMRGKKKKRKRRDKSEYRVLMG